MGPEWRYNRQNVRAGVSAANVPLARPELHLGAHHVAWQAHWCYLYIFRKLPGRLAVVQFEMFLDFIFIIFEMVPGNDFQKKLNAPRPPGGMASQNEYIGLTHRDYIEQQRMHHTWQVWWAST